MPSTTFQSIVKLKDKLQRNERLLKSVNLFLKQIHMEKGDIITHELEVQYDDDEHSGTIFKKKKNNHERNYK